VAISKAWQTHTARHGHYCGHTYHYSSASSHTWSSCGSVLRAADTTDTEPPLLCQGTFEVWCGGRLRITMRLLYFSLLHIHRIHSLLLAARSNSRHTCQLKGCGCTSKTSNRSTPKSRAWGPTFASKFSVSSKLLNLTRISLHQLSRFYELALYVCATAAQQKTNMSFKITDALQNSRIPGTLNDPEA
jgi:hypothetical protein